ncbi:MAG: hypothetical protein WCP43_04795, partial [Dehalococcoidia bacterium]
FDFWQKSHSIEEAGPLALGKVPSHGCRLLRICRAGDGPTLIGDTLHVTQGYELGSWQVTGKTLETGTVDLGRRAQGSLWLKLPGRLLWANCGTAAVTFEKENDDIYRLDLDFQGRAVIKMQWE